MYDERAGQSLNKFVAKCFRIATMAFLATADAASQRVDPGFASPSLSGDADLDFGPISARR